MKKSLLESAGSLKRTIVFADERTKRVVDGGLSLIAEADRSNLSAAAEKLLLEALLTDRPEVAGPMARVLAGESTVKDELARAFRNNAAGVYSEAASPHLRELAAFASSLLGRCEMDLGRDEFHHAKGCWESIENKLAVSGEGGAPCADFDDVKLKGVCLLPGWKVEADLFLGVIPCHWHELGNYNYTFRFLADAVDMTEGPVETADTIREFRNALITCSDLGWNIV